MLQNGVTKSLAEESFVAHEDVSGAHFARLQFANKAFGSGKGSHQNTLSPQVIDFDCSIEFAIRIVTRSPSGSSRVARSDSRGSCPHALYSLFRNCVISEESQLIGPTIFLR